ncbi:putative damage-inducible protein DinB [Paenibacillus turicensis]|uniref:Damage-inducible protein DinB n=1 Tax=Paenibacillus turicensis TaxID=160487 RepID=A0ABS4FLW6_9BACL|nr:DinB family protein [Paenibacillus turicensis]MBP1903575.1 putative damage-inducible protein DinB [Paenibacillus turicensis]
MNYDFNRDWLIKKFEEIRRRILNALEQLDDEQVNWRPDGISHSISTLIRHIEGNIQERIMKGILHEDVQTNRDNALKQTYVKRDELEKIVYYRFELVVDTLKNISDEKLEQTQLVRNRERTNLDMLHQCAAHYSEHMGQIFYIAKQILQENYKSTSI